MDISQTISGWDDIVSVVITGANGMLGKELVGALRRSSWGKNRRQAIHTCDVDEMDITKPTDIEKHFHTWQPQLVINCAANTDVDGCESNRDLAFAVNAEGPMNLARVCQRLGCKLVHISTDFVFDGKGHLPYRPDDDTGPQSVYGKSKRAGEQSIQKELDEYLIVRTAWLFGKEGSNFVSTIRRLAQDRNQLEVVKDQVGSPTYAADLAQAIIHLVNVGAEGIYHFANAGKCSWYEFAGEIVHQCGYRTKLKAITSAKLKRPARRPAWSVLDTTKYKRATGQPVRPWQEALADYLSKI
jgi:dTDP-4-dehydrorhamnose reductase